ncbi:phosphomannomutase/phosphoglucomutase, partial [Escherichia coli]|nr:phosphomannomutase/phosphoglucomutase [Escherichia coli]
GQDLPDLIADLKEPAESEEIRLSITATDFKAYGKEALADFLTFVEADPDMELEPVNQEGIRVNTKGALGEGWFLLRMSLHEPVMPMNLESDEAGGIRKVKDRLAGFFATKADLKM